MPIFNFERDFFEMILTNINEEVYLVNDKYEIVYVNKNAELERGVPRLVINYKPLNQALKWIRYPIRNKKDLLQKLYKSHRGPGMQNDCHFSGRRLL